MVPPKTIKDEIKNKRSFDIYLNIRPSFNTNKNTFNFYHIIFKLR